MNRPFTFLLLGFLAVLSFSLAQGADELSRQPPALYAEKIAPLLTPLKDVLELKKSAAKDGDGVLLLQEVVHWITPDGRRLVVEHVVNLANNEAGVAAMVEHSEFYKKAITTPHLATGRTILEDGKFIEVEKKGALLHSPQPDADMALYGDVGELRVVFPGVKPGVMTEYITVMEQSELSIPGEFMTDLVWTAPWLTVRKRILVDAPEPLLARLKVIPVGMALPPVIKAAADPGRLRMEWSGKDLLAIVPEPEQPPWLRTGPALVLTTLAGWDDVSQWYSGITAARTALPDGILKEMDAGEKPATPPNPASRKSIVSSVLKKVSDDVRYTGLEFGMGAYQPREPAQVWGTRYGDCKDKSNLLRVLLAQYGISSWLALVNTQHDGEVARNCPSVRWFNHVILAVDDGQGGLIWCDPTMTHVPPGELSSGAADRDVLLVRDHTAEWRHTPVSFTGFTEYEAELKPRAEGGWTGWLQITGRGLTGISLGDYIEKSDRQQALNIVRWVATGLVPRAEVLDFAKEKPTDGVTFAMKVYLDIPGVPGQPPEIRSPQPSWEDAFTSLRTRRTAMFQSLLKRSIKLRYILPKGSVATQLPRPLKLKTPCFATETRWESDATSCTATVIWETLTSIVPPESYEECHTAAQTLAAWSDKTVALSTSGVPVTPESLNADDLLVMPTGDGQLALIERRYPAGGNAQLRRSALSRVAELFPRDHYAVFSAEVQLATLDMMMNEPDAAIKRLRDVIARLGGKVTTEDIAWAESSLVFALKHHDRTGEAIVLARKSFGRKDVSQERRAQIGCMLAEMLVEKDPAQALAVLQECTSWQTASLPRAFGRLSQLLVEQSKQDTLATVVRELYSKGLSQLQAACSALPNGTLELIANGKTALAPKWLDAVEAACPQEARSAVASSLTQARAQLAASGLGNRIHERLKLFLNKGSYRGWDQTLADYASETAEDTATSFTRLSQQGRQKEALRYGLRRLVNFPPDESQPYLLAQVTEVAYQAQLSEPECKIVFEELLNISDTLPKNHTTYLQGRLIRAEMLTWGNEAEAEHRLRDLLAVQDLPQELWIRASASLGNDLQRLHRPEEALQVNETLLPYAEDASAFTALLRAVMLHVELGSYDKACELAQKLRPAFSSLKAYLETADTADDLLKLTQDPAQAAAYWESTKNWWPDWEKFERNAGIKFEHTDGTALLTHSRGIGVMLAQKMDAGDLKSGLETLGLAARSARVSPHWCEFLGNVIAFTGNRFGQHHAALRPLVRDILMKSRVPEGNQTSALGVTRLILLSDQKGGEEAIAFATEQWPFFKSHDLYSSAFARIWLGVTFDAKRQQEPAMQAVQDTLNAPGNAPGTDRALSVAMLGDALMQLRRPAEASKLLQEELKHPAIKGSNYEVKLKEQFDRIVVHDGDTLAFARAVEKWFAAQPRLAWLKQAPPLMLTATDLKTQGEADLPPSTDVPLPVQFQRAYQILTSSEAEYSRKIEVWNRWIGVFLMSARCPARDISAWVEQGLNDRTLPEPARNVLLWESIKQALARSAPNTAMSLLKHPLAAKMPERLSSVFQRRLQVEQCDVTSLDAVKRLAGSLTANPNEKFSFKVSSWVRLMQRVQSEGQFKIAEWMLDHPGDLTGLMGPTSTKEDDTVVLMKFLNITRDEEKFHALKNDTVVSALGDWLPKNWKTRPRPECFEHITDQLMIQLLPPDQMWEAWTWTLAHEPGSALSWSHFSRVLDSARQHVWPGQTLPSTRLIENIHKTGVTKIIDETAWAMVNWNDEAQRDALMEAGSRLPGSTFQVLAGLKQNSLIRTGKAGEELINSMDSGTRLSVALAQGNVKTVKQLLESTPLDVLLHENMISLTLRAYRLCDMEGEARVAAQKIRKLIDIAVASSWVTMEPDSINTVISLWSTLGEPDAVPDLWTQDMGRFIGSPYWRGIILTRSATLRSDWPEALRQAEILLKAEPENTPFEYDRAKALMKLGRKREARASVEIFLQKEADNPRLPEVRQWLEEINKS